MKNSDTSCAPPWTESSSSGGLAPLKWFWPFGSAVVSAGVSTHLPVLAKLCSLAFRPPSEEQSRNNALQMPQSRGHGCYSRFACPALIWMGHPRHGTARHGMHLTGLGALVHHLISGRCCTKKRTGGGGISPGENFAGKISPSRKVAKFSPGEILA